MEYNLYGLAMSKFKTVTQFSKAIGWGRQKASRVINKQQNLTASDIEQLRDVLEINDADTFMQLFFPDQSTKRTA